MCDRFKVIALLVTASTAWGPAHGALSEIRVDQPASALYRPMGAEEALAPEAAVRTMPVHEVDLDSKEPAERHLLLVSSLTGSHVQFEGYVALASPVHLKSSKPVPGISVSSVLTVPKRGKKFIMFPLVTALDANGTMIGTLVPLESSRAKGNIINNNYALPAGTEHLLVHSRPEMVSASFLADLGVRSVDGNAVGVGVASALTGILGGLFVGVLGESQVARGKVALAPIGFVYFSRFTPEDGALVPVIEVKK